MLLIQTFKNKLIFVFWNGGSSPVSAVAEAMCEQVYYSDAKRA